MKYHKNSRARAQKKLLIQMQIFITHTARHSYLSTYKYEYIFCAGKAFCIIYVHNLDIKTNKAYTVCPAVYLTQTHWA